MHCPNWQFKFLLANKSVWFWNTWLLSTIKGGNSDIVPVKGVQRWERWIEDCHAYLTSPEQKETTYVHVYKPYLLMLSYIICSSEEGMCHWRSVQLYHWNDLYEW